jgi:hypothetical protein
LDGGIAAVTNDAAGIAKGEGGGGGAKLWDACNAEVLFVLAGVGKDAALSSGDGAENDGLAGCVTVGTDAEVELAGVRAGAPGLGNA